MRYMLMFNETQSEFNERSDPSCSPAYWGGWNTFIGAMAHAGIRAAGHQS